jgi:nitroimidazol reductase NimA-like FMN-containing flavoprotein (pyridoxamine 5'-phosphate oxidase superfamily)
MENDALMDERLQEVLLARLATADPRSMQPHLTVVWYLWDGESAWFSAFSSTRKVKDLVRNPRAALLIDKSNGGETEWAYLLEGPVELVSGPGEEFERRVIEVYTRYLGEEGVLAHQPQSWITDAENRLVRLNPEKIYRW